MAVRTEFHTESHIKKIRDNIDAFLILAADEVVAQAESPGITPVISGNLVGSTYRGEIKDQVITFGQNAEYAMYVEARKFHFSYAIQLALPGIRSLLKRIKID